MSDQHGTSEDEVMVRKRTFVERTYADGEVDWIWIRTPSMRSTDIDCTELSNDELAARIAAAKAQKAQK